MSNGSVQPDWRSNYRGDYREQCVKPVCTQDLLCWSFQVARGMEYLASRKVLTMIFYYALSINQYSNLTFDVLFLGFAWRFSGS